MLNVISLEDTIKILNDNFFADSLSETVTLDDAVGRVTAENIVSEDSVPSFSRSTMDGYAVKSADTYGSGESMPAMLSIIGEVLMGENADCIIHNGECVKISTGGMIPSGADAVVPVENTDDDNGVCLVYKSVSPFENIIKKGDDVSEGECVIKKGTTLSPAHIGTLASIGKYAVKVVRKPVAGIISTGNEIIEANENPAPGKIREVNSHVLSAMCKQFGCNVKFYGIVKDEYDKIFSAVKKATDECDIVLISGGSSAGTKDMTVNVIENIGTVFAHGLAVKPGKPTIIGKADGKAIFGLPGHPGACFFVTQTVVKPLIDILLNREKKEFSSKLIITENISSNHGREEFVCVKTDENFAVPVLGKSGLLSNICEADGYIKISRNCEGICKGETVEVFRFER